MKSSSASVLVMLSVVGLSACAAPAQGFGPAEATPVHVEGAASATSIVWFPPTETATLAPAATVQPTEERRPGIGGLLIEDPMTSATHWNAAASGSAPVTVSERGLSVSAQPGEPPVVALHRSAIFSDMYIEITARPSLCRGKDTYGLVFRAPNDIASYRFAAACDGTAAAARVSLGTPHVLQPPTATSDVPVGAPGEVKLGIWVGGTEFRFFLNDRFQFSVTDKNYPAGGIGVFVEAGGESPAVVTFLDLKVYGVEVVGEAATQAP